jgi:hypothetical protein
MKALDTYRSVFNEYEQAKKLALSGTMKFPFFSNYTNGVDQYLKDIDRDDVIKKLQEEKKGKTATKVKTWAPLKCEGFHSLFLEKHILYRYAAYDKDGFYNASNLYKNEEKSTEDRIKMISDVNDFMTSWESQE